MPKPVVVPVAQTEDLKPRGREPLPSGAWEGTIEDVRVRDLSFLVERTPDELTKQGYSSNDVGVAATQFGELRPLEGQEDVGARKFFQPDILIRDGNYTIDDADIPDDYWQLRGSQRHLMAFARALGVTEEVEMEDGTIGAVWPEDFVEEWLAGAFKGQKIVFILDEPRRFKKKDGTEGFEEVVEKYQPAV